MRSKGITSAISYWDKFSWKSAFFLLFLITLFVRFPFFFRDYIDRDESTFILMGQALVDGHLPYTFLWDLKPPVIFYLMGGIITLFGKSFIAIRFFGVLAVSLTGFFTYNIGCRLFTKQIGFWSALGSILLLSLFGSLQGVMSEHVSMLFFMPGMALLVSSRNYRYIFLAGLLTGLALMTKINLAYATLFIAIYLLIEGFRIGDWKKGIWNGFLFGMANLIVILVTVFPYIPEDNTVLWWNSVILAPLEYTSAEPFSPGKILPFVVFMTAFFVILWRKRSIDFENSGVQLLLVALLGICVSFVKGGKVNGHYLIQLYPMLLLFVSAFVSALPQIRRRTFSPYMILLLFLIPVESYREYFAIYQYKIETGSFFNGEGIWVPEYLQKEGLDAGKVLFLEYHIGYWLIGKYPLTPAATHPSNLCREELFPYFDNPRGSTLEELKYVFEELQPPAVILRKNKRIFDKEEVQANEYTRGYINQHYQLHDSLEAAEIYIRSDL